ncbi:MAG: hypothetical protein ACXAC5_10115 [Promethearchaeota archaeon]|jgi:hypothetical protein
MLGDLIFDVTGGNIYLLLLGAFLIFYLDSMVLTILPEILILTFVGAKPDEFTTFIWLFLLLCMANIGDVAGNYTVYLLFKRVKRYHNWVHDKLQRYVGMLVLKDEKLILLNRVAPALPMCGAFMAACNWSVKKSLFYIYIGGVIKYSIILFFFGFLSFIYPEETALWITLISVGVFLVISFFLGKREQKRLLEKGKQELTQKNQN